MRRTLLAVGIAVLASMLFAPHGGKHGVEGWGPFFCDSGLGWVWGGSYYYPGWALNIGRVMIDMLALEIVFLGVLFAVSVNIRWWPKKKNRKPASTENCLNPVASRSIDAQTILPKSTPPAPPRLPGDTASPSRRKSMLAVVLCVVLMSCVIFVVLQLGSFRHRREKATGQIADADTTSIATDASPQRVSRSPFATAADFAKYATKLREQEVTNVQPQVLAPTGTQPATQRYPWKTNIVTTVFWIGEKDNRRSVWDANWTANYGGVDNPDPSARRNYIPVGFTPRQNPFYCALPYNDVSNGQFKPEAPLVIPWFKRAFTEPGNSVCWHRWVAIRKGDRTCYAEWEDCGPFLTDHFQYVFGNERPKPNANHGAGLNVSPAVRDYLGLAPTDVTDWQFVEVRDVPPGPWRSYGENNHFVIARRQAEQQMMDQKQPKSDDVSKK